MLSQILLTNLEKKWFIISRGWKCFEAESVSRPKLSQGWKCLPTVLGAESFSRLKVSPSWKFLGAANVSGLKVSPGWKFLGAASVSGLKLSQLKVSQGWKCLSPSWLKVSGGWKCLGCKFLAMKIVSGPKVSSRRISCTAYLVTPLDLVTLFWQTKCVTKSGLHCTWEVQLWP